MSILLPTYLLPGDQIAITCPASQVSFDKALACAEVLESWGYRPVLGKTIGPRENYFAGTDEERAEDLQGFLDGPEIKAVLFGRGGYGTGRIIDKLSFDGFVHSPKWLIGFSDITLLLNEVYTRFGTASIHGPMAGSFLGEGGKSTSVGSIMNILMGNPAPIAAPFHKHNVEGTGEGQLVGGNLAMLTHAIGSRSLPPSFKGKILFLEDIGEHLYKVDRMLFQLMRANLMDGIAGLLFGGFTDLEDTVVPFGKDIEQILGEHARAIGCPVGFGMPFGHIPDNRSLVFGGTYRMVVDARGTTVRFIA